MQNILVDHETAVRTFFFFGVFIAVAIWEMKNPRRTQTIPRNIRWAANFGIVIMSTLSIRFLFPFFTVGMAVFCQKQGWGFLNYFDFSYGAKIILSLLFFDMAIYLQHVLGHTVPLIWRLHRMHHADLEYDVSTGLRFHPIEVIFSIMVKMVFIAALGPPAVAVLISEISLNVIAMFNHGNVNIPEKVDKILRLFIITPDMHRVHHSATRAETDSNYGFFLPWWDWIGGTYVAQPQKGHKEMTIGLEYFRELKFLKLHWLLAQPFISKQGYPPEEKDDAGVSE